MWITADRLLRAMNGNILLVYFSVTDHIPQPMFAAIQEDPVQIEQMNATSIRGDWADQSFDPLCRPSCLAT